MSSESLAEIQSSPRVKRNWISWVQKADSCCTIEKIKKTTKTTCRQT